MGASKKIDLQKATTDVKLSVQFIPAIRGKTLSTPVGGEMLPRREGIVRTQEEKCCPVEEACCNDERNLRQ